MRQATAGDSRDSTLFSRGDLISVKESGYAISYLLAEFAAQADSSSARFFLTCATACSRATQ